MVTYNRYALLHQNIPVDILLIDNASTDGTFENLYEEGYLDKSAIYYKNLESNQGGAGGFYEGIKWAMELKYDYMWLMDDDAEPALDGLENFFYT